MGGPEILILLVFAIPAAIVLGVVRLASRARRARAIQDSRPILVHHPADADLIADELRCQFQLEPNPNVERGKMYGINPDWLERPISGLMHVDQLITKEDLRRYADAWTATWSKPFPVPRDSERKASFEFKPEDTS